jgi:hypothetical protein
MKLTALLWLTASVAAFAATEEQFNRAFAVQPGGKVMADVDFGEIDVKTNATSEVTVDVWRKVTRSKKADEEAFLRDCPVTFTQDGNTVTIRSHRGTKTQRTRGFNNRTEGKYTLTVPAQFAARLTTAGGGISVEGLVGAVLANTSGGGLRFTHVHGPLTGTTAGGGIDVTDCEGEIRIRTSGGGIRVTGGGGSLDGKTSGGGVSVKDFAGSARVRTSGGGITLVNIAGEVDGVTSGGPINATLHAPLPGPVNLSTSGGGVTVKVPETSAFRLDAETSAGSVILDLPITTVGKIQPDRVNGVVNGGETLIRLRSSVGSIHLKKL